MPTIVIKNLPDSLHLKLKERSKRHHRSVTKEVIAMIETAVALPYQPASQVDPLAAIFAAGDQMAADGVDFRAWAANSRDVWR